MENIESLDWGQRAIELEAAYAFELGTLSAAIQRSQKDWVLEYEYSQDRYVRESTLSKVRVRPVFQETEPLLTLRPACATRNVVATPMDTIHVPPSERITLFMSSPLWVQFLVHADEILIADLPLQILSDTWFGPNTRHGELCYSNVSNARIYLDRLPPRPERIITPVTFINAGEDAITIDRINLPLPLLSVYQSVDGYWTQEVVIHRESDLDEAKVEYLSKPPTHVDDATKAGEPRSTDSGGSVTRALSMLFR